MKKVYLLLFFLFPLFVYASSTEEYTINAYIQSNGDMIVHEYKKMDGSYNGYITNLRYSNNNLKKFTGVVEDFDGSSIYNATSLIDLKVYAGSSVTDTRNLFSRVSSADKGVYGVYTVADVGNGYNLTIYQPSSYNLGSLVIYTLKDVVVIHNDVCEIAWDFISKSYQEDIDNLTINIYLPGENSDGNLRVFSHGQLNGYNKIVNNKMVSATYNNLKSGNAVDVRVVFDKNLITNGKKKSGVNGLDNILKVEKIRADKANEERESARTLMKIYYSVTIFELIVLVLLWVISYLKYDKEYMETFTGRYNREFIDDYNVEVIDYLMKKSITPNALSAAIMDLVYKKYVTVEKIKDGKKDDYLFTRTDKECTDTTEEYLLDFLFNDVGNDKTFTTSNLKSYAKSTKTYDKFTTKYTTWKNKVVSDSKKQDFYEKTGGKKALFGVIVLFMVLINFLIVVIINTGVSNLPLSIILYVLSFIYILYLIVSKKRTKKGNDHYLRWRAFKNFLSDFGKFDIKDLPEIALWERYLVYAVIFGIADKVQKEMNVKIKEMPEMEGTPYYSFHNYYIYNDLCRTVSNTVNRAVTDALSTASSQNSSSGGFGGGSSFGGGGFGGGGSSGGRF